MMEYPWQYDETTQVGTDYQDEKEVRAYDLRMQRLRDVAKEVADIEQALEIDADSIVWEIGTGTGECALGLARFCKHVFATDVSPAMLAYARHKAEQRQIDNVTFELGGFLSGFQPDVQVGGIVSQLAFHHLPDFWKSRALALIGQKLHEGGRFYLRDVVFPSKMDDYDTFFDTVISGIRAQAGEELAMQTIQHIRTEFSTLDWILEGMINRSGLRVIDKNNMGFLTVYVCEK
jgi:putative AdoMet-dependent methyltransferase